MTLTNLRRRIELSIGIEMDAEILKNISLATTTDVAKLSLKIWSDSFAPVSEMAGSDTPGRRS